nr:uncharacterized mitochondrial protein AtMg00810-like [Tanacetum cinerariifolium]
TCQPVHVEEAALFFEKGLRGSIENIVVCGGPFFKDLQWRLSSLPIRFGGLGLYSAKLVSSYAFVASRAQSWVLQDHILRDSGICSMDDDYVSTLACLRDTIPSFDVSGFTNKDTVPSKAQQTVANVFFSKMVKDVEVHFDMNIRQKSFLSVYTTADVLVFGWVGGKHACVDLTGVSPLVGLSSRVFTAGQAALKAASGKVTKHEKACIENQHVFIPFAFDTFGFLAPKAVEILSRVQRVMHNNVMTSRSTDVVVFVYRRLFPFDHIPKMFTLSFHRLKKSDGIFISQDKYVVDIMKKFDFSTVKTASTPIGPNKALVKDVEAQDVDVHLYRSIIRSLIYLTASSPDITFAVCACVRFQVTPKTSHLHVVKRIFRYLKGQPKLGLWYPRGSPFDLEAYFDSDYARASLDRKSTTEGCQFFGKRLISWQCKKQTIVANSTTKAEYVAAAS